MISSVFSEVFAIFNMQLCKLKMLNLSTLSFFSSCYIDSLVSDEYATGLLVLKCACIVGLLTFSFSLPLLVLEDERDETIKTESQDDLHKKSSENFNQVLYISLQTGQRVSI